MDELQDYELDLLCDNIGWSYKNEWEMARLNSYCSLSAFGKPKKSIDKFFPLPTDKNDTYKIKEGTTIDLEKIEENKNKILEKIWQHKQV